MSHSEPPIESREDHDPARLFQGWSNVPDSKIDQRIVRDAFMNEELRVAHAATRAVGIFVATASFGFGAIIGAIIMLWI